VARTKKKVLRGPRNYLVPLLVVKSGAGAHLDRRAEANKKETREWRRSQRLQRYYEGN